MDTDEREALDQFKELANFLLWVPIETPPERPLMAELFYANYPPCDLPPYRDVRRELAYWSPEQNWWCEINTGHRIAEFEEDERYEPTHWRPLPRTPGGI